MSISLNTANSNSVANYDTIDGDCNVHNDQTSDIALLAAKQPDKLSEIVNSFSNTSIFCEIALQRLQLSQSYRTNAGMQMEQMKEYQGQITALNMLDQYAREGKTIKIEAPENLEQYKSNVEQARIAVIEHLEALSSISEEIKSNEFQDLKNKLRDITGSSFSVQIPADDNTFKIDESNTKKFIDTTIKVDKELENLLSAIGVSADFQESFTCKVRFKSYSVLIDVSLDPARLSKDDLNNLISRIDSESTIRVNANALIGMGFTEVPKFADSKIGEAEKEKFTVKIEMKKDEVDQKMNTTMAYLQDYIGQAQANMTKASKNLDKYDELLAEVVSKKK